MFIRMKPKYDGSGHCILLVALFEQFLHILDTPCYVAGVNEIKWVVFVAPFIFDIVHHEFNIGRNTFPQGKGTVNEVIET